MLHDLRYSVRLLLRSPGFTLFALLALGLGIGANVIVFSVQDALLLRGLPAPHAERLVRVYEQGSDPGIRNSERTLTASIALPPVRYQDDASIRSFYRAIQRKLTESSEIKSAGAITLLPLTPGDCDISFQIVGQAPFADGQQPVAQYRVVSGDYFQAAGIPLLAGRFFDQQDGPDSPHRILINRCLAAPNGAWHHYRPFCLFLCMRPVAKPSLRCDAGRSPDLARGQLLAVGYQSHRKLFSSSTRNAHEPGDGARGLIADW